MRQLLNISNTILLLVAVLFLTACGPVYKTSYSYEPPASMQARSCVAQCGSAKSMCNLACSSKQSLCEMRSRDRARVRYEQYKAQQRSVGKSVTQGFNDFYYGDDCRLENCGCDRDYNDCYTMCGGRVLVHTQKL